MDSRLHDEVGKHLDAIANGAAWMFVSVYMAVLTVLAWIWWD